MAISKLSLIKFLELAITSICIGLHERTINVEQEHYLILLVAGTFVGYLIILLALLAGHLLQTPVNKRLDIFFSLIGCSLFIACGALIINNWENQWKLFSTNETKNMVLSKASLAILNGAVFLVDMFLTIRD